MPVNILIVEDLFIEANDLRIILQKAGHTVCGVAKSVDQAMAILKREKPDMVLLDVFLKGDLTGIHLAKYLGTHNIPFIFLSANSNPSTLEAAKATQPYGFLVKPFREKDILVALDIADYRHRHAAEMMQRQEKWLSNLLGSIINEVASHEQKLSLLAKAFKPFIPFDLIFIDTDSKSEDLRAFYGFQRVDFNSYKHIDLTVFLRKIRLSTEDLHQLRKVIHTGDRSHSKMRRILLIPALRTGCRKSSVNIMGCSPAFRCRSFRRRTRACRSYFMVSGRIASTPTGGGVESAAYFTGDGDRQYSNAKGRSVPCGGCLRCIGGIRNAAGALRYCR